MKFCPYCNSQLEDYAIFCTNCGMRLQQSTPQPDIYSTEYTQPNADMGYAQQPTTDMGYAQQMPTCIGYDLQSNLPAQPIGLDEHSSVKLMRGVPSRFLIIGAMAFAVVVIAIILISVIASNTSKAKYNYVLYTEDDSLYYRKLSENESEEVWDDWCHNVNVSKRANALIFITSDDSDLYYCKLQGSKIKPTKIESDVASASISNNGKTVYYRTSDGDLYMSDLKTSTKLKNDVIYFTYDANAERLFTSTESNLYIFDKANETKIGHVLVFDYSSNMKYFYYIDVDNDLYLKKGDGQPKHIANDVSSIKVFDSGEAYYCSDGELFYYKGGKSTSLLNNTMHIFGSSSDKAVIAVMDEDYCLYGIDGKKVNQLGHDNADDVRVSKDGSLIAYLDSSHELHVVNTSRMSNELYTVEDVNNITISDSNEVFYVADDGDLYVNQDTKIDSDAYIVRHENGVLYYMTDDKDLKTYKNGSPTDIADDITDLAISPTGTVAYSVDNELYLYKNGKSKLLTDDAYNVYAYEDYE